MLGFQSFTAMAQVQSLVGELEKLGPGNKNKGESSKSAMLSVFCCCFSSKVEDLEWMGKLLTVM